MSDTIFALSSGRGIAGIAIVRMSGPAVRDVFVALCGGVPVERQATLMVIRRPAVEAGGRVLDRGICLFFAAPRSFTGEDMGEFQVHGGRAVVGGLLKLLGDEGLRMAEPGEFTRRAFVNGKLDLLEVEALGDVIAAETEGQLRLAQRLAGGGLSRKVEAWRRELVSMMAMAEALIDFSDEGDVAGRAKRGLGDRVGRVLGELREVLNDGRRGERLRDGVTIVIAGPPNAGKSTLLNRLARREAAIVSPFAGTTRDPIEMHLDLGGVPVTLVDTAGLREGVEGVERMGIERARDRVRGADLVMWLEPVGGEDGMGSPPVEGALKVRTKWDLASGHVAGPGELAVSALTGAGMVELVERLTLEAKRLAGEGEDVLIARARQRAALSECMEELQSLTSLAGHGEAELEAEHLRLALRALARLTGKVDVEEVLGEIFAGFCIGK